MPGFFFLGAKEASFAPVCSSFLKEGDMSLVVDVSCQHKQHVINWLGHKKSRSMFLDPKNQISNSFVPKNTSKIQYKLQNTSKSL
jgi:hypothetical protein